jgi:hypothetical protein
MREIGFDHLKTIFKYIMVLISIMRANKDFVVRFVRLNGHKVKVLIPTKTISLEEGLRIHKKLLRR